MTTRRSIALALLAATGFGVAAFAERGDALPAASSIEVHKDRLEFRCGKELAGGYSIDPARAKPFFWPLNAPGGVTVTRGWPMEKAEDGELTDHVHQKSAWFCHGDIIPEGLELKQKIKGVEGVDFWSETPGHGVIVCTKVDAPEQNGAKASVATFNEWRTANGDKVLDETRTLTVVNYGEARLFIVESDLHASVCGLTFGDTKEGAFGIRVRHGITELKGKGTLTNAEGKTREKAVWGQLSDWCDYSGPVGDTVAGIALFADPSNPSPTCWHSRGYGLMAANPFGREKAGFPAMKGKKDLVKLAKGEHLKLRFGLLLHRGDVEAGKVAEYFAKFTKLKG